MKKFVVLLLAVVTAISMNITVFAEVVDYSACPYCGYLWAELYDSGQPLMHCPICGYTDSTWNCCSGSPLKSRVNSPYETYAEYLAHRNEGPWVAISNTDRRHVLSHHTISSIVSQMPHITEEELQKKLTKKFFNPSWSDSRVINSVNYAYNEALRHNIQTGSYTVNYLSENITIYMTNGVFNSGWGRYEYTLEEFLEQYGGM